MVEGVSRRGGGRCGAVPNSFTRWDRAKFLLVLFPFSFVFEEWVSLFSDTLFSVSFFHLKLLFSLPKMLILSAFFKNLYLALTF